MVKIITAFEVLSISISILAIIASVIALMLNNKANEIQRTLVKLTQTQTETTIFGIIRDAKVKFLEIASGMANAANEDTKELLRLNAHAAIEDVCNAFESACARYLEGIVDKNHFWRMYDVELREWVNSDIARDKYIEHQSTYYATMQVYDEWNKNKKMFVPKG